MWTAAHLGGEKGDVIETHVSPVGVAHEADPIETRLASKIWVVKVRKAA